MPPTSEEFEKYTWEDLWIEFYEDYYEKNPNEVIEMEDANADIQFVTGDEEIDHLEKLISDGADPAEIDRVLSSWEKDTPAKTADTKTTRLVEVMESVPDIGDGFDDVAPSAMR